MSNNIEMPKINFEPLSDRSKNSLLEKIWTNPAASGYLVYLRYKYSFETEWKYFIECYDSDDVMWFSSWYKGQQDIEYLGVAVIG